MYRHQIVCYAAPAKQYLQGQHEVQSHPPECGVSPVVQVSGGSSPTDAPADMILGHREALFDS